MFEDLNGYHRIYVVGPQRSGTRIAARMIANDTGIKYIDEKHIFIDSLSHLHMVTNIKFPDRPMVFHMPALTAFVQEFATPKDLVVFMIRNQNQIKASEERINWKYDIVERWKLAPLPGIEGMPSRQGKLTVWRMNQRRELERRGVSVLELQYHTLAHHPMWKDKSERKGFKWNQIK
jgi:hypothetical protein